MSILESPIFNRPETSARGQNMDQKMKPVVLIVEDEALIRMGAAQMVEDAGFEVLEASNADEAITMLETRSEIRAVFTDINMSGSIDGLKLAHAIRRRWPPDPGPARSRSRRRRRNAS